MTLRMSWHDHGFDMANWFVRRMYVRIAAYRIVINTIDEEEGGGVGCKESFSPWTRAALLQDENETVEALIADDV